MKINAKKTIEVADVLITGVFEKDTILSNALDTKTKKLITDYVLKQEGFEGKFGEFYLLNNLKGDISKILVVGLGKKDALNAYRLRELGAKLYKYSNKIPSNKKILCDILGQQDQKADKKEYAKALLEGVLAGSYKFDKYKTIKCKSKIASFDLIGDIKDVTDKAVILNSSLEFTKNLINEQAYFMTPSKVAAEAQTLAKESGLEIKVYDQKELEKMNFGAFLAVARGSEQVPKLIHLKYVPKNPKKKIAIIGKGITFDAGGLDIKPAASMMDMKDDMSGCACVLGVMKAIAKLKPAVEVHAISALCENMPSGKAYKQGDILTAKNGKTIEVDNTDAEGRLTLADALTYADELKVDEIIDIATLTGACVVALGSRISGIMGTNKKMVEKLIETGKQSGEDLWEMPIYEDMQDNIKSDIADMRNTGGREAGTSVAGKFLSNFVKNKNWAHIDIAGTAHISKPYRELGKGATGVMVKTLTNYICG